MMLAVLLSVFLSFSANASYNVKAQIHDVDHGNSNEETLVMLTSGQVVRIKDKENKSINDFEYAKDSHQWFEFTLSDKNDIESYTLSSSPLLKEKRLTSFQPLYETYVPTVIENIELVKTYFHESKYVNKESQCYNRAHIWTYEWFNKYAINSNKTWLFFTRKYIRKFKFDWWFHVSPSVRVMEDGILKEKIMDVKYARGPIDLKSWTDIFMRDDANCPVVKTYSEYANYPESGSCFTLKTSMYHYQPVDIESSENWGTIKANWYDTEVKQAYLEAFDEVL